MSALIDADDPLKNFSDWDGDMPGIAITATDLRGGTLWYSTNGGTTWLDVGVVSTAAPRLLAADASTRLAFQPAASSPVQRPLTVPEPPSRSPPTGAMRAMRGSDGNGAESGYTRVYRWQSTDGDWTRIGFDLDGEAAGDLAGWSVALSADGRTVATGAPHNAGRDGTSALAGHARVHRREPSLSGVTDTVSIAVTPLNRAPTDITLTASAIAENLPAGSVVGTFSTVDLDAGDAFNYALVAGAGDADNAAFTIVDGTLKIAAPLNCERRTSYEIRVESTDRGGESTVKRFTIDVMDVDEPPAVDHVVPPVDGVYRAGQPLSFTAVLTQPVTLRGRGTPEIPIVVGRASRKAVLVSGLGTNRLVFEYRPAKGDTDADGVALGAAIRLSKQVVLSDPEARVLSLAVPAVATGGIIVDTTAPRVLTLAVPAPGTYRPGDELLFTATFSERVFVAGTPTVTITIGKIQRQAVYQSGSGSSSLVFRYTVQPGDAAPKGITIRNTIATADATLTDTAGNVAKLSFKPPSGQRVVIASALPGSLAAFTRW